jgi:ribosomal protein S4
MEESKNTQLKVEQKTSKTVLKPLSLKKIRAGKKRLKDYGKVLLAKQLLRALYNNPRERTFKKYFLNTTSMNAVFEQLNSRLDVVLTAMGGAVSSKHARQLINHGKITVNGHVIKERGYLLKDGDIVASTEKFVFDTKVASTENAYSLNLLQNKIASLKPSKIPSFLGLKTPVFANLFVNTELGYGIYYSKNIDLNDVKVGTKSVSFLAENAGLGWKNTKVRAIKSLLVDLKIAASRSTAKNSLAVSTISSEEFAEEKIKKIYSVLYSLVQAYYSRQH